MKHAVVVFSLLLAAASCAAQLLPADVIANEPLRREIGLLERDPAINADSAARRIAAFAAYPPLTGKKEYLFECPDTTYGTVPVKIWLPAGYRSDHAYPLVLLLHGAVARSAFDRAYTADKPGGAVDPLYDALKGANTIVVRAFADPSRKFNWVVNPWPAKTNATFAALVNVIRQVKRFLNVDDDRVFAYGHSDGADGAFALDVYEPSVFAGFVAYNSMLTNIDATDIYLNNSRNRPLYLVHSDLDALRPEPVTGGIVRLLKTLHSPVSYKVYEGYRHYDAHLAIDAPNSTRFLRSTTRNAFASAIFWETNGKAHADCDWLGIAKTDISGPRATWHVTPDTNDGYYAGSGEAAAADAHYNDNTFTVNTSRVTSLTIRISGKMVDLSRPIKVVVNGKEAFNKTVNAAKGYLIDDFSRSFDRKTAWLTELLIPVSQ